MITTNLLDRLQFVLWVLPSLDDYAGLRQSVGWDLGERQITLDDALKSLARSPLIISVYDDKLLVGCARIIGDTHMFGFLEDVMVHPDYQSKGVGKHMVRLLIDAIDAPKGYVLTVCPSMKSVDFYLHCGFKYGGDPPLGFQRMKWRTI